MADERPVVIVLGGINGAGKTTASRSLLAETLKVMPFVNADVIAQGLSGFDPEGAAIQAGRVMLQRLDELVAAKVSFAFETTLAARTYAGWLRKLRDEAGYTVKLFYFWLGSADLAVSRVAQRVRLGGHHIPEVTVRQRYGRSIRNFFELYLSVVNFWELYDNTHQGVPRLIAAGTAAGADRVIEAATWQQIQEQAR
jgi:predicted ABC-type ATPase